MRAKVIAAAALFVALIAGAYFYVSGKGGDGNRSADPNAPLALVDASDRSFDGSPAIALTFSQPLDPKTAYDKYIRVFEMPGAVITKPQNDEDDAERQADNAGARVSTKPEDTNSENGKAVSGAWVVGENPRLLYFPHIKPRTRYVVTVQAGLPGAGGKKLNEEARYSILSAPVSPAYYFASNGMVLPARQNGGLPVVTVNVPEVDIQFLRVKNEQMPHFLDKVIAGPRNKPSTERDDDDGDGEENEERGYWDRASLRGAVSLYRLDELRNMAESVYLGRFLTEQKANRRSVTYISVEDIKELKEPGIYVAVMSQPGRFRYEYQTTYFYVSDLGLHVRRFGKSADAFVSSLADGKAVKGVEVDWLDAQGKVVGSAETDGEGHAVFAERPRDAKVVVARKDKMTSLIALKEPALDLSEYDIAGMPYKPVRLFAYSGRNLYRPGESFDLSVLARDADGRAVPAQPVQAILRRPDGKSVFTAMWRPDARFPGYYTRRLDIPADAQTGFWTLELRGDPGDKVPATVFRFGVEEFLPERMKLDLVSRQASLSTDAPFDIDVKGVYLYGAPAAGNRLLGVAQFERDRNPLAKQFPGFEFGNFADDALKSRRELDETTLDDKGDAQVSIDLDEAKGRESPVLVRATLSLLESGGRPVVRSLERTLWPAPALVGVRPLFTGAYTPENSPVEFEVIRADSSGNMKPLAGMPVSLFREDRNYYWRFDDQRGWHSGFTESDELVETAAVTVPAGGRGKLRLPVRYGRYRLEISDPDTGLKTAYRFYAGWSARDDEAQGVRPDRVSLKLDKAAYRDGETARLTITPPHKGEALITVDGDKVIWTKRASVSASGTTIDIPLQAEWKRHDLYVNVLVLRPGNEGDRVTPARALGVVHLPLERGDRKVAVSLAAPQKVRPETTVKVRVKAPDMKGQKAVVTLSAVDVGILNITRFASPDPHGFFFGKLRYGADQNDVYGRLIEKMQGQKGKLKFGGDSAPKPTRSLPKKVKLVDLFSGPVQLNDQGEAEIPLALPDFNGSLRLMAVVAGAERFGSADAEMTVAAPLVAELAAARFLSFGDQATVALDLQNLSGASQSLKVAIRAGNALAFQDAERSLTLKDQEKRTLQFNVDARAVPGLHNITLQVSGDQIKLERSFPLTVQAPTPRQALVRRYTVEPGKTLELKDAELSGFHRDTVAAHMVVSDKPPIDVRSAVQGLLTYPYGCAEQTTSTAYPHVFIDEAMARRFGLKPYSREQRVDFLDKAVSRLGSMQAPNGGFSLWGNIAEHEYWLSAYVTAFLQDARDQGFAVPEAMLSKAMDFLLRGLQDGAASLPQKPAPENAKGMFADGNGASNQRFGALAYGAYVLARERKAPLATLRQMHDLRFHAHSNLPLVQLGIALRLMGDPARGDVAIAEGVRKPRLEGYWWWDYGSPLRDAALSHALLDRHKIADASRDALLTAMLTDMEKRRYYSTQEKMALFMVGQSYDSAKGEAWSAEVAPKAGKAERLSAKGSVMREMPAPELAEGISLNNTHAGKLYVELALSGNALKPPAAKSDVISLTRTLHDPEGRDISGRALKTGETVFVHVMASSRTPIGTGMIVDSIPAGLEIENLNIVQGERNGVVTIAGQNPAEAMSSDRIKHVEYRDDRFVAAVKLTDQPLHLFYRARVVTPGRFVVPPVYAEDMYRPELYGLAGGGDFLTVTNPLLARAPAAKPAAKAKAD
ncbi:hypothetical protein SAMN06265795_102470 [Noviherbaspirillum humi]|uniref:Alpha-2-macroglobulin family protein n=1 Tax=Noviherbaspirillum humi TaxID=1688639 RepID=A0A239E0R3_9BURK|nr:alpha-2-macroglobulin [Noviherbaspirillum humi]SNS38286.1 hypothetical protein SAMN06265795_102470 [Noviherbaspirillum humi]